MKVKEKDLVIGDEYYLDDNKTTKGFFVGFGKQGDPMFYSELNTRYAVSKEQNGTIDFVASEYKYEEV